MIAIFANLSTCEHVIVIKAALSVVVGVGIGTSPVALVAKAATHSLVHDRLLKQTRSSGISSNCIIGPPVTIISWGRQRNRAR